MSDEHPVKQPIRSILAPDGGTGEMFTVGYDGVTRIEATQKSGEYAHIPYVRVWRGDVAVAEYNQHHLLGVYFAPANITGGMWPQHGGPEDHPGRDQVP